MEQEHYDSNTMDDIEYVIQPLCARDAVNLFNVLKYFERRNRKGQHDADLEKARDYAYRLSVGEFYHVEFD